MRAKLIPFLLGASMGMLARPSLGDTPPLALKKSDTLVRNNAQQRTPVSERQTERHTGVILRPAESPSANMFNTPPDNPARHALLDQARFWESRNRDDLAAEALNKLLSIAPQDPDGLAQLAFLHMKNNQKDKAKQVLERLRHLQPRHPDIARIETLIRLEEGDKERLRQARMLARTRTLAHARRSNEALAALRELYRGEPPTGDLALEYWLLVGDNPDGWEPALAGLRALAARYPDNLRYRLALAEHIASRKPDDPAALKTISELAKTPPLDKAARDIWRRAMMRLDPSPAHVALIRKYLESEIVEDTAVKEYLAKMQQAVEEQRRLMADPYYVAKIDGLALLDGGRLDAAEERLLHAARGRFSDPDLLGGLGLLRMRQGHHAEAQAYLLQAQQRDPNNDRWTGLLGTARFWGLMREASDAADAGEFRLAERKLNEARTIDPREAEALAALGRIHAAQGRTDDAEKEFREALRIETANLSALKGLASLFLRTGRDKEIDTLLVRLGASQRKEVVASVEAARVAVYKERAEALLAKGDNAQAVAMLERAVEIDRDDPWLRFNLARLYGTQGDPRKGDALFNELLARRPGDAAAHYAYALTLARQDLRLDALATLERVAEQNRNADMTDLQRRLWIGAVVQRVQSLARDGKAAAAKRLLDDAERHVGNDPDLLLDLADARIDAGDTEHAHTMLVRMAGTASSSFDWRLRHARLLAAAGGDDIVPPLLQRIDAMRLDAGQKAALDELKLDLALREAENLRRENRTAQALQVIAPYLASHPRHERLLSAQARYLHAQGMPREATAALRRLAALDAKNRDAAIGLIEVLIETGEHSEARKLIADQLADPQGMTPDQAADLIGALIELGDDDGARRLTGTALGIAPGHPRVLAHAGQLALRDGQLETAADYLRRSLAVEAAQRGTEARKISMLLSVPAPDGSAQPALEVNAAPQAAGETNSGPYRRLADLMDRQTTWLSSAVDKRTRSGTQGTSEYSLTEIPIEWKRPQTRDGRWTYRADIVEVNAGGLDLAASGQTFGSALLCQADCATGIVAQHARGIAFNAMLERDAMRYDLGTTPLGFPVQSLVGGILRKGDLGPFGYSLDISRRPLTGSMLSYAGTRDPRTGQVWGGVQATGARLGLSLDQGGTFGGWSSLGLHKLTGKNVLANDRMQLMAGLIVRVINEDDRLLQFGTTGMHWRMSENAGEYTFGHGGYYSPGRFTSLSLPVTYGQRHARWSYVVRAALSASRSEARDAPYFPTDSGMQAEAERLSATNGVSPFYTGGPGRGVGRSLALTWEYQAASRVFVGGRAELDRSADYSPNRFVMYLRYAFDRPSAKPVSFLPEPVNPTSQY